MYIVKPELDDQAVQQEIEKVGQLIQTNGGQVKKVTPWGKRRLAYTVKDQREGHYVVEEFDLHKGSLVYIEGRLQTRSWEGQDGQKRKTTEVNATEVQFLEPRSQQSREPAAEPVEAAVAATPAAHGEETSRDVDPEDIPF